MMTTNHRTFHPSYASNMRINNDRKAASSRDQLIIFLSVASLTVAAITACVVVHLGIENYRRLNENRALLSEIIEIKRKVNDFVNGTFSAENKKWAPSGRLQPEGPAGTSNKTTASSRARALAMKVNQCPQNDTDLIHNKNTKEKFLNDARQNSRETKIQYRYYMARFKELSESIRSLQISQDFLREQIHQRLGALEIQSINIVHHFEYSVSFMASISSDHVPKVSGNPILFDEVLFNGGVELDQGRFYMPTSGTYLFIVNLTLKPKKAHTNFGPYRPLNITLQKNHVAEFQLFALNAQLYTSHDVTSSRSVLMKLKRGDVVDVYVIGSPNWYVAGHRGGIVSTSFSGFLLHTNF